MLLMLLIVRWHCLSSLQSLLFPLICFLQDVMDFVKNKIQKAKEGGESVTVPQLRLCIAEKSMSMNHQVRFADLLLPVSD